MPTKPMYLSKTVWFNLITTALDILALTEFRGLVPPKWSPYLALGQAVGNILLRRLSSGAVTFS